MDCKELMTKYYAMSELPTRSTLLVLEEFLDISGSSRDRVNELVDMGWLTPSRTAGEELLFRLADVYRLRKLERLCADFDMHTLAGTIVVDLLARIEELERRLK